MTAATLARAVAVGALLASLAAASGAQAGDPDALRRTVEEAVETYTRALNTEAPDARRAAFRRAQRLFSTAAHDGAGSAELYTNLGNAALQAEDLGAAILAYRRALRVDPRHGRALQNLEHARSLLPSWVPRKPAEGALDSFFFWHRSLEPGVRRLAGAASFAAAAVLLALGIRLRQSALRNAAMLPFVAWVAIVGAVLVDPADASGEEAVVTLPEVVARAADSPLSPSAFSEPLPSGVEVRVVEDRAPWLRVRLANGRDAWVPESSVERIDAAP